MKSLVLAAVISCASLTACGAQPEASDEGPAAAAPGQALTAFEQCQESIVAHAVDLKRGGASDAAARQQLEIGFALCVDPSRTPANAAYLGLFNADFARLGSLYLTGALSLAEYRAALTDRTGKYQALQGDRTGQEVLAAGDADGDLIADRVDRCPGTLYGVATDARGCSSTERPPSGDRNLPRQLAGATVLYNPSCNDAPMPVTPVPIAWGRGHQTPLGTDGYNLAVTRSNNQPAGCEIFYEIDLRFSDPGLAGSPPVLRSHMVFREGEDLLGEPSRATFGLPIGPALSPGRTTVREAMGHYSTVSWRVRAVNGSQHASPWSSLRVQGPAPSGVDG